MFKIGDRVRCIKTQYNYYGKFGCVYTIKKVGSGSGWVYFEDDANNTWCNYKRFELVPQWEPKNGEMIEVKFYKEDNWKKSKFIGMNGNSAVCVETDGRYLCWGYYRKIQPKHTITIDGKNVEISEESFNQLKDSLLK